VCGGVLFEYESEAAWWASARRYADTIGDAEYLGFIEWLRGQCLPNLATARALYRERTL
jgi:hypothetical protein